MEHGAIVFFGMHHKTRVLLRIKKRIRTLGASVPHIIGGARLQVAQLCDDLVLAGSRQAKTRRIAVALAVFLEMIEAGIAGARTPRRFRIDLVQITQHLIDRREQAIEIEAIEADSGCRDGSCRYGCAAIRQNPLHRYCATSMWGSA